MYAKELRVDRVTGKTTNQPNKQQQQNTDIIHYKSDNFVIHDIKDYKIGSKKIFLLPSIIIYHYIWTSAQINNRNYKTYAALIMIIIISAGNMHTLPLSLLAGNNPFQENLKVFFSIRLNYASLI